MTQVDSPSPDALAELAAVRAMLWDAVGEPIGHGSPQGTPLPEVLRNLLNVSAMRRQLLNQFSRELTDARKVLHEVVYELTGGSSADKAFDVVGAVKALTYERDRYRAQVYGNDNEGGV